MPRARSRRENEEARRYDLRARLFVAVCPLHLDPFGMIRSD